MNEIKKTAKKNSNFKHLYEIGDGRSKRYCWDIWNSDALIADALIHIQPS